LTHLNCSDSECFDSSCNVFERSECLCCNWNMLFCDVVFILVFFALLYLSAFVLIWFISIDDFFSFLIFNVDHAVYHWRNKECFAFVWFIFVNDFFFLLIFNVDHAVYHWRDEEHLVLIWFISVNDFFFFLIFDVDHVIYYWRDEECSELWYEFLISFILSIW